MKQFFMGYVPVINKRYLEIAERYRGEMGVFSSFVHTLFPHLERDVRALKPEQVADLLGCIVVGEEKLPGIYREAKNAGLQLVMPDEDVSHGVASEYFDDISVEYLPIWLRWDRQNALSQQAITPDKRITSDQFALDVMGLAYEEAKKSSDWWRQIGAVLVSDSQVLVLSHNHHLPTAWSPEINGDPRFNFSWHDRVECYTSIHAEASIIAEMAKRGSSTKGTSLYATTFPCPVCARIISAAGISRVFYREGYSKADAWDIFSQAGIEVIEVC
jgi:dCMP deaminase